MDHCASRMDLVGNALNHYATILNKSVLEFNLLQINIKFVKASLITESYFAEELIEYITKNGTVLGIKTGNTTFHYGKIRKTILNALERYVEVLKNTIKIMTANSADPYSDFLSMEQEINICISLKNDIETSYGNITRIEDEGKY